MTGIVDYDAEQVVPTNAKLHGISRSQGTEGYSRVTTDLIVSLAEDSFNR